MNEPEPPPRPRQLWLDHTTTERLTPAQEKQLMETSARYTEGERHHSFSVYALMLFAEVRELRAKLAMQNAGGP